VMLRGSRDFRAPGGIAHTVTVVGGTKSSEILFYPPETNKTTYFAKNLKRKC